MQHVVFVVFSGTGYEGVSTAGLLWPTVTLRSRFSVIREWMPAKLPWKRIWGTRVRSTEAVRLGTRGNCRYWQWARCCYTWMFSPRRFRLRSHWRTLESWTTLPTVEYRNDPTSKVSRKMGERLPLTSRNVRLYDLSIRASKTARARLLWVTLSLVLPVTLRHSGACCAALALSAAIKFVTKISAPCFTV